MKRLFLDPHEFDERLNAEKLAFARNWNAHPPVSNVTSLSASSVRSRPPSISTAGFHRRDCSPPKSLSR